ncbi:class I SAM-dependent methyltransferase [Vibrio sp.]|uniref:Class I SAM-dependent methyltransferase n=1 Tax=Vibrio viridaestus TaxID=2487322 RepID=A0A3N9TBL8_9VIBR|nr:class I SAM-dependent methyltransferase [Vibrio viridaestus]MDC0611635.1 class I SAM-dependent methyltransferase [Vibrio sp.]RQW61093.1 class I SAM-dependent methyltransferase [Vibrio viridaestus]
MGISFAEPERLTQIFDGENREEWQRTSHILSQIELKDNDIIADIGAGTGYFSNLFSNYVKQGKVYAIDCEPNMIDFMIKRFTKEKIKNISPIQSMRDDPCIPNECTVVFLANTYRFIENRFRFLQKIHEQTQPNTRYIIVDYKGSNARVSPTEAVQEVIEAGFTVSTFDTEGCPDHYILKFTKMPG